MNNDHREFLLYVSQFKMYIAKIKFYYFDLNYCTLRYF